MKMNMVNSLIKVLMVAALAVFLGACEQDEDTPSSSALDNYFKNNPYVSDPRDPMNPSTLVISPTSAGVTFVGQKITFIGSQGDGPYQWDVAVPANGHVIVVGWSQGIYVADQVAENNVIVYDTHGHSAVAKITVGTSASLSVSPNSASLASFGASVAITASGGTPPYTWAVGNSALGGINVNTGSSVIYTRSFPGNNTVMVTDSTGAALTVPISQP